MPTDEPATEREEHAHFHDIAACGVSLRANIVYRFGWTIPLRMPPRGMARPPTGFAAAVERLHDHRICQGRCGS